MTESILSADFVQQVRFRVTEFVDQKTEVHSWRIVDHEGQTWSRKEQMVGALLYTNFDEWDFATEAEAEAAILDIPNVFKAGEREQLYHIFITYSDSRYQEVWCLDLPPITPLPMTIKHMRGVLIVHQCMGMNITLV